MHPVYMSLFGFEMDFDILKYYLKYYFKCLLIFRLKCHW